MKTNGQRLALAVVLLTVVAAGIWLATVLAEPRTAAEALAAARKVEARQAAAISAKKAVGALTPDQEAGHLSAIYDAYGKVGARFPKAPEAEEADWRVLQLRDENSTGPEARIALAEAFLDRHTSTTRAADLRWRVAELTHRELKRLLAAIDLYEGFATKFREDPRAPEALFRVGQIYEEIKEFARAVDAYQRVAKEFPRSPVADQAQFRAGSLLAERLERREEAAEAFAEVERNAPAGSRLARQAGEARQRLVTEADQDEQQKARMRYYRGVREVPALDRFLAELDSPPFQMLRDQKLDLLLTTGSIHLSPADRRVTATASMRMAGPVSTSTIAIMLGAPLEVSNLFADLGAGKTVKPKIVRRDDFILVDFGDLETPADKPFTIQFDFGGVCQDSWGMVTINTSNTLLVGNHMLPTLNLGDARPLEFEVTVPTGYSVVATGQTTETHSEPDGRIRRLFIMSEPVFWTGLAVANYQTAESEYRSTVTGRSLPLSIHLNPGMPEGTGPAYLEKLPAILDYYERLLGPFPYDKLAIAQVGSVPGGLGTPGVLMLGPPAFVRPEVPAEFLAHEVSHAWFGNLVALDLTVESPVWLSEGFAEYLDALYHAHENGPDALARTMRDRAMMFFRMTERFRERALADLRGNITALAPSTYTKGAYVLHMLRGIMGDENFGRLLRRIVQEHGNSLFNLPALQRIAEESAGQDLDWFFEQWVRQTGLPRLHLVDACEVDGPDGAKSIAVVIVQKGPRPFRLPLDVEVELADGTTWTTRLDVSQTTSVAELSPGGAARTVRIDPQSWILKHPRAEEWERSVSTECTTAGLSGVEAPVLARPADLGMGLDSLAKSASIPATSAQPAPPTDAQTAPPPRNTPRPRPNRRQ